MPTPERAVELERELRGAHLFIGRMLAFLMQQDLVDEWQTYMRRKRAEDAAEAARNPTGEAHSG